jgi:two-component system, chemotaxis family, CheB/CheR fusion protein
VPLPVPTLTRVCHLLPVADGIMDDTMRHRRYGLTMDAKQPPELDRNPGLPVTAPDIGEEALGLEIDNIIPSRGYDLVPVVALGGSAGSIGALREFFQTMSPNSGVAFVVILHLSPEHESTLDTLLQRTTSMPVRQAEDTHKLEPNHVYVIPPAKQLWLEGDHLRLSDLPRERGRRVPVDLFFRALADTHGPHSVAIVLSGVDGDGALGIKRIKERGGLTIAQEPTQAQHSGMPEAAIGTGMVDWVLPVEQMPGRLLEYVERERRLQVPPETGPHPALVPRIAPDSREQALREVLLLLRTKTGRDFSYYKRATIVRRIARRMQVNGLDDVGDYLTFLRTHPGEASALLKDLLISVTNFFRDREAFAALEARLPQLFANKGQADTVRVWVPACATGEEAYSIAMLLCEHSQQLEAPPALQVFATDLDQEVIAAARQGHYPASITADVSPERLQRFFTKHEQGYRVRRELREMVLFALHDLLKDSPFSRLDLVSCRNLLIYLDRDAQNRAFAIFHFALRPDAWLFLGASEGVEDNHSLFSPVDKKHRIYAPRNAVRPSLPLPVGPPSLLMQVIADQEQFRAGVLGRELVPPSSGIAPAQREPGGSHRPTWSELHLKLLERFAPPSMIVNGDYDILHLSENAARFLQFTGGEPSTNLLRMVHPMLRIELRSVLFRAAQSGGTATAEGVPVDLGGVRHLVDISASATPDLAPDLLLVVLRTHEVASSQPPPSEEAPVPEPAARHLEAELEHTKGRLRDTIERYEASTEELKASNEELQAMNEELRSATEELETSREELQSINEELTTVNQELKGKVDEVSQANSDLHNLMGATAIPTIFLDRDLRIMRFTPSAAGIFNIIPTDTGRRLGDLSHHLDYSSLLEDAARVLEDLSPIEREVHDVGGGGEHIYIARLLPYRTTDDHIAGVVLTLVDVTERLAAQVAMMAKEAELREAQRIALMGNWSWDRELDELTLSPEVVRMLERDRQAQPRCLRDLEPILTHKSWLQFDTAARQSLVSGLPLELDVQVASTTGQPIWLTVRAEVTRRGNAELAGLRGTFQDVTVRRRTEEHVRAAAARLQASHAIETVGIVFFDPRGLITDCNAAFLRMSGYRREDLENEHLRWDEMTPETGSSRPESPARELYAVGHVMPYEKEYARKDGARWWALIAAARVSQDEGVAYVIDITQKKAAEAELQRTHEHLEARVRERTLELNQANSSLRSEISGHLSAELARQELLHQLVSAQEEERRRISRELHDEVGQQLTGIMLGLKSLQSNVDTVDTVDTADVSHKLQALRGVTEQLGREIHQLALELRPTALDDLGLVRTLTNYLEDWATRTSVRVDFHTENLEGERLPGHIETTLYRIVQEALNNVLKHAGAEHVSVIIEQRSDHVLLIIEDDGSGFDVEALEKEKGVRRLGLVGIRERAALLQGELTIESSCGHGTTLFVRIPFRKIANA